MSSTSTAWTPEQSEIIEAGPDTRIILNAGPGTGKTAVACGRVASLVARYDVPASSIWLISFTRTAVKELRDRIYSYVGPSAYGINIATLDSQAFSFVHGFTNGQTPKFSSYDENILQAKELLEGSNPDVLSYLDTIRHLFVDEAQDVVGDRAALIEALIAILPAECGVTILCDEAQAIYGFSYDELKTAEDPRTLPERLRESEWSTFRSCDLEFVHRTSSESLLNIFKDTRKVVLDANLEPEKKLNHVREDIERNAGTNIGKLQNHVVDGQSDLLVLFRRRAEVLLASGFLSSERINHRVRLSKTPPCLHIWLAVLFWDFTEKLLSRDEFDRRWAATLSNISEPSIPADIWTLLLRFAGTTPSIVDMHKLRSVLGRSRPPIDFTSPELGRRGPILGTIHSSKGREAPLVHLMLPPDSNGNGDLDEEARVLFVGATRAKETLKIGQGYAMFASQLESGRASSIRHFKQKALVEIGMDGDVDPAAIAGNKLFLNSASVLAAQNIIWDSRLRPTTLIASVCPEKDWAYELRTEDGKLVAHFTKRVNNDLWKVANQIGQRRGSSHRPPEHFFANVVDVRTIVLAPDDPQTEILHEPFSKSGFLLAPVFCGLPSMFFPFQRRRWY